MNESLVYVSVECPITKRINIHKVHTSLELPLIHTCFVRERWSFFNRYVTFTSVIVGSRSHDAYVKRISQHSTISRGFSRVLPIFFYTHRDVDREGYSRHFLTTLNHVFFYLYDRDIRRRCAKAKDELSGNLHSRLRY